MRNLLDGDSAFLDVPEDEHPVNSQIVDFVEYFSSKKCATLEDIADMAWLNHVLFPEETESFVMQLLGQGRIRIHPEDIEKIRFVAMENDS